MGKKEDQPKVRKVKHAVAVVQRVLKKHGLSHVIPALTPDLESEFLVSAGLKAKGAKLNKRLKKAGKTQLDASAEIPAAINPPPEFIPDALEHQYLVQ